jgi:hypothetical protein
MRVYVYMPVRARQNGRATERTPHITTPGSTRVYTNRDRERVPRRPPERVNTQPGYIYPSHICLLIRVLGVRNTSVCTPRRCRPHNTTHPPARPFRPIGPRDLSCYTPDCLHIQYGVIYLTLVVR